MSMADFNQQVITEFRENDGEVGGMFEGMPHDPPAPRRRQVRRRSAIAPLVYLPDGEQLRRSSRPRAGRRRTRPGTTTSRPIRRPRSRSATRRSRSSRSEASGDERERLLRRAGRGSAAVRRLREEDDAQDPGDRADAQGHDGVRLRLARNRLGLRRQRLGAAAGGEGVQRRRARVRAALRRPRVRRRRPRTCGATTGRRTSACAGSCG